METKVGDRHALYQAALDADDAFQAALVGAYGLGGACEARYRVKHSDAGVQAAKARKVAADLEWHEAQSK